MIQKQYLITNNNIVYFYKNKILQKKNLTANVQDGVRSQETDEMFNIRP